ncbi:resistin-like gamma [Phodopus roborovskii]|uniref:LOC101822668 protein n=1 Tax=Phodopus roborovskii TaxID=109678 RepID=A0AAU9ZJT6_PHORO|nr:resistin-like gamma [Phodopus roborovskii]CAH6792391.1 LOC101822668 [Phodopus roborovskii]
MKTTTCCLLIFLCLLQLMVPMNTEKTLDSLLEEKIKKLTSCEDGCFSTVTKALSCTSIKASGRLASCPPGTAVTGCACGYGCGSWDIQNGNTCHCQCAVIDWVSARCCQLS